MATDGVKIIDGDLAYDIYGMFAELYNAGASVEELKERYEAEREIHRLCGDEDYEIYVTAYALAFWEIGELTDEMLAEVKNVIDRKAGVEDWTEQCGVAAGKARQRELDKFLAKISVPRKRPKKREIAEKTIGNDDEQRIDEAENLKMHGKYDEAKAAYKTLLAENPDLHEARYKYLEMLCDKAKQHKDCPGYRYAGGGYAGDFAAYQKFIIEHTDWAEIEESSKYMIARRDTGKLEFTSRKKNKVCDWYIFVASRLWSALMVQKKYEEAIQVIEEFIQFTLSRKGTDFGWVNIYYSTIYWCYLALNDAEKTERFKEKCKAEWTRETLCEGWKNSWNWDWEFREQEEQFEKSGIESRIIL